MRKTMRSILLITAILSLAGALGAQEQRKSPHESTTAAMSPTAST